uniref:Uncharacterized protein n=1 Tax=Arundo donax TaxID=35708 RepID=A0A0A8ZDY2_ARUDO
MRRAMTLTIITSSPPSMSTCQAPAAFFTFPGEQR